MTADQFIESLEPDRRKLIEPLRNYILKHDPNVKETVGGMMGKQMLCYTEGKEFKYALSSVKSHMSFHNMVIYGGPNLHSKYSQLLPKAKFQKGCINFKNEEQMPLPIAENLIKESAAIDFIAFVTKIRNDYTASKKQKTAGKKG